jgi:membrane associated rhomboid family serine protease
MVLPRADRFTKIWMGLLIGLWVLSAIAVRWIPHGADAYRALIYEVGDLGQLRLWSLVTYSFFDDVRSPFGVLFNCIALFFFAPQMRARWGSERFILFAILTSIGGAVAVTIAGVFGLTSVAAGAGAITVGLVAAWGLTFPDRTIMMMFVFPMRALYVVYLEAFIIALEMLSTGSSAALHAGGLVTAVILVLGLFKGTRMKLWWDQLLTFLRIRKKPKLTLVPPMGGKGGGADKYVH